MSREWSSGRTRSKLVIWVWLVPGIDRLILEELTEEAFLILLDVQILPGAMTEISVLTAT